jgi:putative flavoprotein involved in K+ transport
LLRAPVGGAQTIALNSRVHSLAKEVGTFVLDLGERRIEAEQVVVATGPFQTPRGPAFADGLAPEVFQRHRTGYRRPAEVPEGTVLVVGGGNTGFQIAKELSASHTVEIAIGSRQTLLPQRLLGRDLFWWLTKLGLLERTVHSRLGRQARNRDTLIGSSPRGLRRYGIEVKPRAVGASGRTASFADGSRPRPSTPSSGRSPPSSPSGSPPPARRRSEASSTLDRPSR